MIRRVGRAACRCLHIPHKGEEQHETPEAEHAGAELNVALPGDLACSTAAHRPVSLRQADTTAQVPKNRRGTPCANEHGVPRTTTIRNAYAIS